MDDDFYEEDEPIETIKEILQRPADTVTARPRTRNKYVSATYSGSVILGWASSRAEQGNRGAIRPEPLVS